VNSFVARHDLAAGQVIGEEDIEVVQVIRRLRSADTVIGREVKKPTAAGQRIDTWKLVAE
jgi:flagella basal body P-ring formation protein FlgA